MRILVIGKEGQVARALFEQASAHGADVRLVGRPLLDLADPSGVGDILADISGDVIVNAAAYTAVDQAESEPDLADAINGIGAGAVAGAAAGMNIPVVQISTDYVFDGTLDRPYREDDAPAPVGAYGRSKLLGEEAVADAHANHAILRTSWIYSPFGKNFVRTMLRLARDRDEIAVVGDQIGSPTSAHAIADGILKVCANLISKPQDRALRGVFHMNAAGDATWAEFAAEIFAQSAERGGPSAKVRPIPTSAYPTPAQRPANSRLDCARLSAVHGVSLPDWRISLRPCIARILDEGAF